MGKVALPRDFAITDEMRTWANRSVPEIDIDRETERFCDYWRANGKTMADWCACWRNWIRNSVERHGYRRRPSDNPRVHDRFAALIVRADLVGFRRPYPVDTPDTYETALKVHERNVVPMRRKA